MNSCTSTFTYLFSPSLDRDRRRWGWREDGAGLYCELGRAERRGIEEERISGARRKRAKRISFPVYICKEGKALFESHAHVISILVYMYTYTNIYTHRTETRTATRDSHGDSFRYTERRDATLGCIALRHENCTLDVRTYCFRGGCGEEVSCKIH